VRRPPRSARRVRTGPGAWDSLAIRFGYRWYPNEAAERAGNAAVIKEMIDRNVRFINDTYAGANGSIPDVTRWVEGATMFDAVERTSRVRRVLMDNFDERAIQPGEPMHLLNMRFAHVYLHHRYSLEGLVKYVGGMDFRFAMRGDGQTPTTVTMLDRAGDARAAADVRQVVAFHLDALRKRLAAQAAVPSVAEQALREAAVREIEAFFDGEDDATKRTRYAVLPLPWP
jgi:hypothetical protein